MEHLDQARHTAWYALRFYLRACEHAGLMPLCDLEYRRAGGWEGQVWRWHHAERGDGELGWQPGELGRLARGWTAFHLGEPVVLPSLDEPYAWRLALRVARIADQDRELARLGRAFLETHPEHPEVLSEIFLLGYRGRRTRALQRRVRRTYGGLPTPEPVAGYRRLRLWLSAKETDQAARVALDLVALGEPPAAIQKPYNAVMERTLAAVLVRQADPEITGPTHADRVNVAIALEGLLRNTGELRRAERVWARVRKQGDDLQAALRHGALQLALGDSAEAAAEQAVLLASSAPPDDRGRLDRARWRFELGEALELHAKATDAAVPRIGQLAAKVVDAPDPTNLEALAARSEEPLATVLRHHAAFLAGNPTPAGLVVHESWSRTATEVARAGPTAVGEPFQLAGTELPARTTVIVAWASWCGPCKDLLPELDRLVARERASGRAVTALAVSADERAAAYSHAVQRLGLTAFEVQRSPDALRALSVSALPTVWMVDDDGVLRGVRSGYSEAAVDAVRAHLEDR